MRLLICIALKIASLQRKMISKFIKYVVVLLVLTSNVCLAQPPSKGIAEIDKAITQQEFVKAESILQNVTNAHYNERKPDSLVNYIFYVGKLWVAQSDAIQAEKKVLQFVEKIKSLTNEPATLRQCNIEVGQFYSTIGQNNKAYNANLHAYKDAQLVSNKTGSSLALIQNNLATFAQRMGDVNLSLGHQRLAIKLLLSDKNPDAEILYTAYNGMGAAMWYASKTDSASYYFNKSLEALQRSPRNPLNQYYRPAVLLNNLSALYKQEGKVTEGINALKSAINNLKLFIETKEPHPKKTSAITFQLEAIDNLGATYKDLGDYKKTEELQLYSYNQKKLKLSPNDPAIFISEILLGQLYFATKDFNKSLRFLNSGLENISKADGDYLFWQADACNTLALLHDYKKDEKLAAHFYEKADSLYEESLQGSYDDIYLEFLGNAAIFYAENGNANVALTKGNKALNYVIKNQGAETLPAFYQLLNLSEINYKLSKFREAITYSDKGLAIVNKMSKTSENLLDSVRMEIKKPKAILYKNKAAYQLLQRKDVASLQNILSQLDEALALLERRKSIISDEGDINLIMSDHAELLEFVKKLNYDLFKLTSNTQYLDRLISLQESGIYNRIRARLEKNDSLKFANLPAQIRLQEQQLKAAFVTAFQSGGTHNEKLQRYFAATENWNKYQQNLRQQYPHYYNMRYAKIFRNLNDVQKSIPAATTLIRYFFIDKDLFAFVADRKQKQVFQIDSKAVEEVSTFAANGLSVAKTAELLNSLYRKLWAPLAKNIHHKKIIIIPDGVLYNLSFEILTPLKINSFKELATKSLLANYTISYQYSLFLVQAQTVPSKLSNNFIAFAPGFSDKIKAAYTSSSTDPLQVDKNYFSLLPQPFTIDLAAKIKDAFGGRAFLHDQSTESSFKLNAGNNKIIHIGTHAESNNNHPEYSRLIFAKNMSDQSDDNSLYVDEIYNCDLTSNLTVLTACESGKPGYQDGEGMISLAHAFNYAGSESILTGLWKIDEQASALLLDVFYENLKKGLDKDEALRLAKLSYLGKAEGRMLAPQYWAGLVIMGDTSPIVLPSKSPLSNWIIAGIILLVVVGAIVVWLKNKPVKSTG